MSQQVTATMVATMTSAPGTDLILPNGDVVPVRDRRAGSAEYRDPRGSTQRLGWQSPTMPQVEPWDAEQAFRLGVAANVVAYRCVQLRARACSRVPLVAGRKMGDHKTINESARIARLLGPPPGGPAPKLSAAKLLRWTFAQKIVTGRRAWEIETDARGIPVAFWPLAAASLRAHPTTGGNDWFRLFDYGPAHDPVHFKPDEVFYGWEPSGNDFRIAESELQSARYDLSLVTLCDRYSLGFLKNNAVPAAVITTTAFPDEASRRKFLQNWSAEFAGADNAGRIALNEVGADGDGPVGDSIDVKVLGLSAKDARLVEQRRDLMAEIAVALGTPWSKLDASGRTFDNAEVEDRTWWEETNLPDLIDLQDDINMQLAPRLGDEVVWFDLRGVRALQRKIMPVSSPVGAPELVAGGIWTVNEARDDYGLEPVAGGDVLLSAADAAALAAAPTAEAAARVLEDIEARMLAIEARRGEDLDRGVAQHDDHTHPHGSTPAGESREADPAAIEQRRARIWHASNAVVTGLESRWQRTFTRLFARQEAATIDRLTGKRGRQAFTRDAAPQVDVEAIFTRQHWLNETAQIAQDLHEETVSQGLARLSLTFGVSFDLGDRWVVDFIEARANQLAGQVNDTTYEAIQTQLGEGVRAGESIDELAARIRSVFAEASTNRSVVIARTEVISAYNGSAVLGASTLPADVVAAQEWIATRDSRTRSSHAAVDGQVVPIGTAFDVGGESLAYPGDPSGRARNTIQCRCTVAFLTPDEVAEAAGRAPLMVEQRAAKALLAMVADGEEFDERRFRRALESVAAS